MRAPSGLGFSASSGDTSSVPPGEVGVGETAFALEEVSIANEHALAQPPSP
jgi:hypothetical protein